MLVEQLARAFARVVASSSVSARPARPRTISPSAQNVIALAVGRRAAVVPPDVLDDAVDVLHELPREPALADPAGPDDRHEPRAASRGGRVEQVLEQPQLVVAPDERRLERRRARLRPPRSATTRSARHAGTGRALPLSACSPAGSKAIAVRRRALDVASPTSTVPGGATDWSRAAVLTRSPATMPWFVAPSVTAASPVSTPARAWMPGPSAADGVDQLERGADRALGVVLAGDRGAPDRHHGVADELLDGAAVARR